MSLARDAVSEQDDDGRGDGEGVRRMEESEGKGAVGGVSGWFVELRGAEEVGVVVLGGDEVGCGSATRFAVVISGR